MGFASASATESSRPVRFGRFSFSHAALELTCEGRVIPLEHQPARVLSCLLRRPGQVVSHAEIAEFVWDDGRHVEVGLSLRYCVRQIRRVLDDDAASPAYVETLPRLGYRWVAPVGDIRPLPTPMPMQGMVLGRPLFRLAAVGTLSLCVGLAVGLRVDRYSPSTAAPPAITVETDLWGVLDGLHMLAHAAIEPDFERRVVTMAHQLWSITGS